LKIIQKGSAIASGDNIELTKEFEFKLKQSKELVAYAEVEIEKVVKDLNIKKSENLELKNCLAERDQEIKQLKKESIINKTTNQNMIFAGDDQYEVLEKKYDELLSEYSSLKTVHKSVLEKNSFFLKEKVFIPRKLKNIKKK